MKFDLGQHKNLVDDCILLWYAIISKIEHYHFSGIEVLDGSFNWLNFMLTNTIENP